MCNKGWYTDELFIFHSLNWYYTIKAVACTDLRLIRTYPYIRTSFHPCNWVHNRSLTTETKKMENYVKIIRDAILNSQPKNSDHWSQLRYRSWAFLYLSDYWLTRYITKRIIELNASFDQACHYTTTMAMAKIKENTWHIPCSSTFKLFFNCNFVLTTMVGWS